MHPPGFKAYEAPSPAEEDVLQMATSGFSWASPSFTPFEEESVHNVSRDDVSEGSSRKTYSLGERVEMYRPAMWAPLERPESAPLERRREASNLALLVSSLQELTAVVARQGEEIRELKDEARATREALHDVRDSAADALHRFEARLAAVERRVDKKHLGDIQRPQQDPYAWPPYQSDFGNNTPR